MGFNVLTYLYHLPPVMSFGCMPRDLGTSVAGCVGKRGPKDPYIQFQLNICLDTTGEDPVAGIF
jgi:hypothetical protein